MEKHKIAKIKNIIGPGFKNQKKWLTVKNFLNEEDLKLNYSERSQKLLKINSITIENKYPNLEIVIGTISGNVNAPNNGVKATIFFSINLIY